MLIVLTDLKKLEGFQGGMLYPQESETREVKDLSGIWRFKVIKLDQFPILFILSTSKMSIIQDCHRTGTKAFHNQQLICLFPHHTMMLLKVYLKNLISSC